MKEMTDDFEGYLYRPYSNNIFEHEKGTAPKFFNVVSPISNKKFGFCRVCHNDARKILWKN